MQISATQIAEWAKTKGAQASLPRLVRRLIHTGGSITQISVPAGDSTGQPGWDGALYSESGNAWVPRGHSRWEMSCETTPTRKANLDYEKRTSETPASQRNSSTYLTVTARRWSTKSKWQSEKLVTGDWADVRAYDADDLEQWLEQSPGVALQFAEELGLSGDGVESAAKHWANWSGQTDYTITSDAFFVGREAVRDRLVADLTTALEGGQKKPYTIRADSVEEAAAFVCAAVLQQDGLANSTLIVTNASGWRFVQKNPAIRVAIAARPEVAAKPAQRDGLVVVIPYAAGDMSRHFGVTDERKNDTELSLERPDFREFREALVALGLDEADAERLAETTGRSWSVFRRRYATNPAIRRPAWLDTPQAQSLSTLCLLSGWSAEKPADRKIVARLAGRPYEDIERDLRSLAKLDDAPILEIGRVWKAKSALELLELFGDRITHEELDRFFAIAAEILRTPDPQLELPDEERYAAQVYEKVRPQSGLLIEALCDTLIKLAVRGPQVPSLAARHIDSRVGQLVRDLLQEADDIRSLSLASLLPALAEAAPDEFLQNVERSLSKPQAPVVRLLSETSGVGQCWYSGLLRALEILAWAPQRLTRVVLVLAKLSPIEIKGNFAASPKSSLVDIFRSWLPQTAAGIEQRIAVLDRMIGTEPDVAFDILDRLTEFGPDMATRCARPKWRDDNAGAGRGGSPEDAYLMMVAAVDRMIICAKGNAARLAALVKKLDDFDRPRVKSVLAMIEPFAGSAADDRDKEVIRASLRSKIHWHRNYDETRGAALDQKLKRVEELYEALAPADLVTKNVWLFKDRWPDLPARTRCKNHQQEHDLIVETRANAVREIFKKHSWAGIERLSRECSDHWLVGAFVPKLELRQTEITAWIFQRADGFATDEPLNHTVGGLLGGLSPKQMLAVIRAVLKKGKELNWGATEVVSFLILAPEGKAVWDLAASLGAEVEKMYWERCYGHFWPRDDLAALDFAVRRLLEARRPRTAFQICRLDVKDLDADLLADMLELILSDEEPDGPPPDSHRIGEVLEQFEQSDEIDRDRLVRLEFGFFPTLGRKGRQRTKALYEAIMSGPKLFAELISLAFEPTDAERAEPLPENMKVAAETAWRVLHECRRQPGTQPDGTVDRDAFIRFVEDARELCRQADRLGVCDSTLGHIVARAPSDADGVWPFEPARDLLDRPELEKLRRAFQIGAMNKRGMTSRSWSEGGNQERKLAETYRGHARALNSTHPVVAGTLEKLAAWYEQDGIREDVEAQLRRERP